MDFKIPELPDIAKGNVASPIVAIKEMEEAKAAAEKRKQFRHDWLIAVFSSLTGLITGAISGIIASIIYNVIIGK